MPSFSFSAFTYRMLTRSGGFLGAASCKILVGFHSNSKAMSGIHPKTCSVKLGVQHINLLSPPNPSANCNSFVPFSPLRGCPGTEQSGFPWSRSRSWLLTSGCVAPWRGLLSVHSGNWAAQKPFTQSAQGGDQPGAPNALSTPAPGQPALPTSCAGQWHEARPGFPSPAL